MVDCEVTICLPGDTAAECTRPCHNLQHPKYSSRKRRVARGEAATKEYELNAMPMAVDEDPFKGENIDLGYGEGYSKTSKEGNEYFIQNGIIMMKKRIAPDPPPTTDKSTGNVPLPFYLSIALMAFLALILG